MPIPTTDPVTGAVFFHRTKKEQKLFEMLRSPQPSTATQTTNYQEQISLLERKLAAVIEALPEKTKERVLERLGDIK